MEKLTPTGSEPVDVSTISDNNLEQIDFSSAANSGAVCTISPDLQQIIDVWPNLPEAVRAGIVAMVRASKPASWESGVKAEKPAE